jgi:hypothetical protein
MAAIYTFLTGHVSVVTGERSPDGRVAGTLRTSFLRIVPLSDTSLPGLRGAKLETVVDKKKATLEPTYRVLLVTDGGDVPMTAASSGGRDRHQALVDHITALAADGTAGSFTVQHVAGGWYTLAPAVVLVVLVGGAALAAIARPSSTLRE